MGREIVHKKIVRVVHEEVKSVHHFSVIPNERHFYGLLDKFHKTLSRLLFFLKQLYLHLLFRLLEQEVSFANNLLASFEGLVDLSCLLEHRHVVSVQEFLLLLHKKLLTDVSFVIKFFRLLLHVYKIGIFEKLRKLIHLLLLKLSQLFVEALEEVHYAFSKLVLQVEPLALLNLETRVH